MTNVLTLVLSLIILCMYNMYEYDFVRLIFFLIWRVFHNTHFGRKSAFFFVIINEKLESATIVERAFIRNRVD